LEINVATQFLGESDKNGMLPAFDQHGNLPPGIYPCSLQELVERFGHGSPEREVEAKELVRFVEWAKKAGVRRILVNGSYITMKARPNDVDIVVLPGSDENLPSDEEIKWPFLHVLIAVDETDLKRWADEDFGSDRQDHRKGIVEVIL
jgi:hypothetical protein